jgi:hemerythrin-like metal-binding protein
MTSEIAFSTWRLARSLAGHLASEERMMRRVRYPGIRWHAGQHDTGRRKMAELAAAVKESSEPEILDKLNELGKWLTDHVGLADRMFAAHMRNNRRERLVS